MMMNEMKNNKLAEKIKTERAQRGWTQAHLAEASGVSERTIQRLEANGIASKENLMAIAASFGIDVKELTAEKVATPQKESSKITLLSHVVNGKRAFDVLGGADAFECDHPHVVGEEGQLVGSFLEILKEYIEFGSIDSDALKKIELAETLDVFINELKQKDFLVFGCVRRMLLTISDDQTKKTKFSVATIIVSKLDNPVIVKENGELYLPVIFPQKESFRFL